MTENLISPYVYWLMHKPTTKGYIGMRSANEKLGLTPWEDLGIVYFSSGPFKEDFKKNPDDYIAEILMLGTREVVAQVENCHLDEFAVESDDYVNTCVAFPPAPMFGEDNPATRPEVRRKISEAKKGEKNHNYGKTLSAETRRKISEAKKGVKKSAETKRKMGEAHKRRPPPSAETRRKMGEAKRNMSEETKRKIGEAKEGEKNPMKRPEVVRKMVETRRRNREAKLRQI